jgi:hypothetical protein
VPDRVDTGELDSSLPCRLSGSDFRDIVRPRQGEFGGLFKGWRLSESVK